LLQVDGWSWAWNFPNTLLFTLTIMTTIGYGQIAPQEDELSNRENARKNMPEIRIFIQTSHASGLEVHLLNP
jgi:hypothetical protein